MAGPTALSSTCKDTLKAKETHLQLYSMRLTSTQLQQVTHCVCGVCIGSARCVLAGSNMAFVSRVSSCVLQVQLMDERSLRKMLNTFEKKVGCWVVGISSSSGQQPSLIFT